MSTDTQNDRTAIDVREWVLKRILDGHLEVRIHTETQTVEVWSYHTTRKKWYLLRPQPHPKSGRWRYVFGPKRSPVYKNVLVWMITRKRLPDGNVDHKDGNRLNDHPSNLQIHIEYESNRQGFEFQQEQALQKCLAYFGFIWYWGHPPLSGEADLEYANYGPDTHTPCH